MNYLSTVGLLCDREDKNFIHVYAIGEDSNFYLFSLHIDNLHDLFGQYNAKEIEAVLVKGKLTPFTFGLQLQS